jgi:hypothetical protein
VELIKEHFIEKEVRMYGVVLGPAGTGKTYLTRLACRLYPSGVIYHEIVDPSTLPTSLAKAIGMRLREDASVVDVLLEKFSISSYVHFYTLPQDLSFALTYVLETLAERAVVHKERHGRNVCLFIDGVDLLAREHPHVFVHLVDRAKYYANERIFRIVLVSSEGHVMSLLTNTSSVTRQAQIVEILDIDFNSSKYYLTQSNMPVSLVEPIYNLAGGRFVYLHKAIEVYTNNHRSTLSEDDVFCKIEKSLLKPYFDRKMHRARILYQEEAIAIMKLVWSATVFDPDQWFKSLDMKIEETAGDAVEGLVRLNLLRYTREGLLTWHSQVVKYGMDLLFAPQGPRQSCLETPKIKDKITH